MLLSGLKFGGALSYRLPTRSSAVKKALEEGIQKAFSSGIKIDSKFDYKRFFFDRDVVRKAVDEGTRRVLSRFGAYVRQRARTSIRWRKGTSPPGEPPYSHVGLLRRKIMFAYDPDVRSVVIGPEPIRSGSLGAKLLEYGGETTIVDRGKKYKAVYRPRPYMRPAFYEELKRLPQMWRNAIVRG